MKTIGKATITLQSLLKYRNMNTKYDFGLMIELRKKGAPIIGSFSPFPDQSSFEWKSWVDSKTGNLIFSWKSRR